MESGQRWNSSAFGVTIPPPNEMNCFLNPNCDASTDRNDPFESALSSLVSSPAVSNAGAGDGFVRELIGKLGSIHNSRETSPQSCKIGSTNNSCYTTPLSSPPKLNLSSLMEARIGGKFGENQGASAPGFSPMNADPGFVERAAKFSCFGSKNLGGGFSGGQLGSEMGYGSLPKLESGSLSRVSSNNCIRRLAGAQEALNSERNGDMGDSREGSSVSEQNPGGELGVRAQNHTNSRKRKAIPRAKGPVKEEKVGRENDEPSCAKRSKSDVDAKKEKTNSDEELSGNFKDTTDQKENNNEAAKAPEPPKDYIHVRARRGQATDSHSLAERVRREKISERMKFLQDLVPGCNKVTGKAVVLDEIINYVQSLQRQVEFLSMKLATVNPRMDINMEALLSKDILQLQSNMFPDSSASAFPYGLHPQQMLPSLNGLHGGNNTPFSVNPMDPAVRQNSGVPMPSTGVYGDSAPQIPSFWEDDLHSIVQMGFPPNEMQNFQGLIPTTQMKTEL